MRAFFLLLLSALYCSAAIDLGPILTNAAPGSTIRLEAGVYTIVGVNESGGPNPGPQLKAGCNLIGKGPGRTIIILASPEDRSLTAIWGLGGNLVSDLTIDCGVTLNSTNYSTSKRNGLYLQPGSKFNRANNVHVFRPYGIFATRKEGFGIIIHGTRSAVTGCLVADPRGDYVQAFSMVGSATVQNCQVDFPKDQAVGGGLTCFGQSSGTNISYLNCHSSGGSAGFYYDTGDIQRVRIEGCTFSDTPVGIFFKNQYQSGLTQHVSNVSIKNNTILLAPVNSLAVGISLNNTRLDGAETTHNAGSINEVLIQGNFFGYKPSDAVPISGNLLRRAISLTSNCTSPVKGVAGINTVTFNGNTYQTIPSGEPWKHRNKWSAATGVTITNEATLTITTE